LGKNPREVAAVEAAKQGEMGLATKYAVRGVEHHEQIMRTGKPIELVEEYVNADGRRQFLHVVKLPVLDAAGRIIGTQGIQFDITEIKEAEATIAHERQLLRTLIDLLPETFYIKDLDGRFLVVNEALARQWGKENPSQMLGLSDADLFPAEQAAQFRAEELKVIAGEPVINRESICVYYDGRDHTVITSKVPFRDSQGRICGLVGIGHDITERKQATQRIADELNAIAQDYYQQWAGVFFPQYVGKMKPTLDAYWRVCMLYVRNMNDPEMMRAWYLNVKQEIISILLKNKLKQLYLKWILLISQS